MKTTTALNIISICCWAIQYFCHGYLESYRKVQRTVISRNYFRIGVLTRQKSIKAIFESIDTYHERREDQTNLFEKDDPSTIFDYSFENQKQHDEISIIDELSNLPKGIPNGFVIVHQYSVPAHGFQNFSTVCSDITPEEEDRLKLESHNVTLPVALMMLDPKEYPSFSRARKACRKGSILIHRGPLGWSEDTQTYSIFNSTQSIRGRVGDRVYLGDVIAKQIRVGGGFYPSLECAKPPFELPVVYEDDHLAVVNKPCGVVVYAHRNGGVGRMTVRSALPYVLKPPRMGVMSIMRRPASVHRLDKPTSGLLIVAKTKPAMVDLTRQFVERRVKKTYTAIVNGIPDMLITQKITSAEAHNQGFDVHSFDTNEWSIIDHPIDEKSAITIWRTLKYANSLVARDNTVTMVELKPKTGRFHQLRRHMAWVCNTPIVGDAEYDTNTSNLRERGMFLCANQICFDHPYFNTEEGRKEWGRNDSDNKYAQGRIYLSEDDKVQVRLSIELPRKFSTFFSNEDKRGKILYTM